ncbi:MAG: four-helix bundle copper-binding protein [Gemmatimonadaceae bacterium]
MPHHAHQQDPAMRDCIRECLGCYSSCLETAHHCLMLGGAHAAHPHMALLLSCAAICETSARAMLLGSDAHAALCRACAEVCRACAVSCRQVGGDDDVMRRCADACDACAESCARMAERAA